MIELHVKRNIVLLEIIRVIVKTYTAWKVDLGQYQK